MFSFLNPYLMWIKIGLAIAVIGGAVYVTHQYDKNAYDAEKGKAVAAAKVLLEESIAQYKARIASLEAKDSAAVLSLQVKVAKMTTDNLKLKKEIDNATTQYVAKAGEVLRVLPRAWYTMDFARVYNDSTNRANGGMSTGSPDTAGTQTPDLRLSDVTSSAILWTHDAIMQQCGKYKAALEAIYLWDDSTHGRDKTVPGTP